MFDEDVLFVSCFFEHKEATSSIECFRNPRFAIQESPHGPGGDSCSQARHVNMVVWVASISFFVAKYTKMSRLRSMYNCISMR